MENYKKPGFLVIVLSIIIITMAGIGLIANPAESEQDLSMLNIKNLAMISHQRDELLVSRAPGKNEGSNVSARAIAEYLDSVKWTEMKMASPPELSATLKIEWGEDQELLLYESDPLLAMVRMNEQWRCYKIGRNDYETLISIIKTAPGARSITEESEQSIKELPKVKDENEITKLVEENLEIIMSSPKEASNPYAYIQAHQEEYENIKKLGGEEALQYMLSQFESGNAEGIREHIMMQLCKELLGVRNNVADETLTPQEWYDALSIRQEVKLPDFEYDGSDPIEKLVYATEIEKNSQPKRGFTIVAPKIFGSYEEDGLLKVFVTTYSATYKLYDNVLELVSAGVVPSAITYKKDNSDNYVLEKYEQAKDGADWLPSIKKFCTMPVSGKEIPGLADKIINHYGDRDDIRTLQLENLFKHLKANGIKDATLFNSRGEIEFSMSSPQYID